MNNIKYNTLFYKNNEENSSKNFNEIFGNNSLVRCELPLMSSKIINLSIQAQPELKLYINNGEYPIIVNSNSIFQWQINQPNTYIEKIEIEGNESINPSANIIISYEYCE